MGGIENFMAALMHQQHLDGHQVSAIVHHHDKQQPFIAELDNGVNIYRIPCLGQIAYAPISPSFVSHLNNIIKQCKPDLIHIHMPNVSSFWCLFSPSARKLPWVIHWHADVIGSIPDIKIKILYPFYRIFEFALLKKAKKIIVTSPVYLSSSQPLVGFKSKTEIVPLGLPCSNLVFTQEVRKNEDVSLLMVGRLTYYKGHSVIIDAIAKLKEQGANFSLKVVGGGELFADIEQQIKTLELEDNITLLGKLSDEDLENELFNTDLLCLPSIERTEAFGVVLLEAMRAGKACLVSGVPGSGMGWVVQDAKTGFVVKHNNVASLVEKLLFITRNRNLLKEYGTAGRNRFEKVFSIGAVSSEMSVLYKQVIRESGSSIE